jgi:hypothetical protein
MSSAEQYGTVHNDKNAFTLPLISYRYNTVTLTMATIENGNKAMNEAEVASPLASEVESTEEVPSPLKKIAKPAINVEVVIEHGGDVLLQETKKGRRGCPSHGGNG